jgi:hypothetical protein
MNLSDAQKEDIATIMRQTECYDTKLIKEKYEKNGNNVLETVYDILDMKIEKPVATTEFDKMREILEEKDKLFHLTMNKNKRT